jgi:DNA phosphorothioation-associated putative methyltransferase
MVGKKVKDALYVHKDAIRHLSADHRKTLLDTLDKVSFIPDFNVIKFSKNSISLLLYEEFNENAFPALLLSTHIKLDSLKTSYINFKNRENPPILHRKELLLPPDHQDYAEFTAITKLAEDRNLFANRDAIGFKKKWLELIHAANLRIVGSKLLDKSCDEPLIHRHRTALIRRDLSQPVQLLLMNGILEKSYSFFDYGCGQGTDFIALSHNGFNAFGWDPHHFPQGRREHADIVNLGFVLNVIEDQDERLKTLVSAWNFTKRALCVAVMISGKIDLSRYKPFGDGIITSRNTFQKYFNQQELRDYVAEATGSTPISIGPGIVTVFKDKALEQDVLFRKNRRLFDFSNDISIPDFLGRSSIKQRAYTQTSVADEISLLWKTILEAGRIIETREISDEVSSRLLEKRISPGRFISILKNYVENDSHFLIAAKRRREDLIVYLAQCLFSQNFRYTSFSEQILLDIKYHFKSQKNALSVARRHLFSLGNSERILNAFKIAFDQQLGLIKEDGSFRCSIKFIEHLPIELRLLIHCADILRGGLDGVDFIDIKNDGKILFFLTCFDSSLHFPIVSEINRVDLSKLRSNLDVSKGKVIYWKSKLMSSKDINYQSQLAIDEKLLKLGIIDNFGNGPDLLSLKKILAS